MIYRFGAYELDSEAGELRKAGAPVSIQPKPLELLCTLIEARDRIVSQDELFATLWPDVAVTPSSLNRAVSHARRAIGDTHRGEAIKSHARRGYRFCADVIEVHEREPAATVSAAGVPDLPPFVGREQALGQLSDAFDAALGGSPRVVLLEGRAGVGKTRLTSVFADEVGARGAFVLRAQGREGEDVPAFWIWAQVLRILAGEDSLRDSLEALARHSAELGALVPELGVDPPSDERPLSGEHGRFLFFDAVTRALANLAASRPTLLLLEDLHWAESGSLRLLEHLVESLGDAPLCLVVTVRDEPRSDRDPIARTLSVLRRLDRCRPVKLGGLTRAQVGELLSRVLGARPPADLTSELFARTEGVPLYLREAVRLLKDRGALDRPDEIRAGDLALPAESLGLIARAFEGLSPAASELMGAAAVIGREFGLAALAETANRERADVLDLLDETIDAGVVEEDPDATAAFRFSHALFREAAYDRLPTGKRARLHLRTAERLERRHAEDPDSVIEALAHHHHRSLAVGDPERAWECATGAGAHATQLLAWEQAALHYTWADEVLEHLEETASDRRFETWLRLGEATLASGDRRARHQILKRAMEVAGRNDRNAFFAQAAILFCDTSEWAMPDPTAEAFVDEALERLGPEPTAARARLLTRQVYRYVRRNRARAEPLAREAAALARKTGEPRAIQEALYVLCFSIAGPDDLEERAALTREMVEAAAGAELEAETVIATIDIASDAITRGDAEDARQWRAEAERLSGVAPPPLLGWHLGVYDTGLALLEGRVAEVPERSEAALSLGVRVGHPYARGCHNALLAVLAWEQGRFAEVLDRLLPFLGQPEAPLHWVGAMAARAAWRAGQQEQARSLLEGALDAGVGGVPRGIRWTRSVVELAHALADVGRDEPADELLALLEARNEQHGVLPVPICYGGPVRYAQARLCDRLGRADEAEDHFADALRDARQLGAHPFVARILADQARHLERRGRGGAAREAEAAAQALFDELGVARFP